jgi:hypothetical protein
LTWAKRICSGGWEAVSRRPGAGEIGMGERFRLVAETAR